MASDSMSREAAAPAHLPPRLPPHLLPRFLQALRHLALLLGLGAAVGLALALWPASFAQAQTASAAAPTVTEPSAVRQAELRNLLRQDCGSCHGLSFKGGLGSPLTPEALRDKPRDSLIATVAKGRPGTAMPPWEPLLAEGEIVWMVDQLIRGLPATP